MEDFTMLRLSFYEKVSVSNEPLWVVSTLNKARSRNFYGFRREQKVLSLQAYEWEDNQSYIMRVEICCRARSNLFQFEGMLKFIDNPLASVCIEYLSWSDSIVRFRRPNTLFLTHLIVVLKVIMERICVSGRIIR